MINLKEKRIFTLIVVLIILIVITFSSIFIFILTSKNESEEKSIATVITSVRVFNLPKGTEIVNNTEGLTKFWPYNIIFSLDLIPSYSVVDKDTSFGEYYLVQEELEGFIYKFELKTSDNDFYFSITNVSLILTLPNGDEHKYYLNSKTDYVFQQKFDTPLLLEHEGLLKIELNFNSSEDAIVWRNYTYCRRWLSEESGSLQYKTFHPYGNTTGGVFNFFNKYKEAFGVLTSSDMMQHRALLLSEQDLYQSLKSIDLQSAAIQISILAIIVSSLTTISTEVVIKLIQEKKKKTD
jgi:hypothetical protein